MVSIYNVLLHGEPDNAADALGSGERTKEEIQAALINAFVRIGRLERQMRRLDKDDG